MSTPAPPRSERLRRAVSGGSPTTDTKRLVQARSDAQMRATLALYEQLHSLQQALDHASVSAYEEHVRYAQLVQETALRARPHRRSLPPRPHASVLAAAKLCRESGTVWDRDDDGTATTTSGSSDATDDDLCTLCAARDVQATTACCHHAACHACFSHLARCPWCRAAPLALDLG